MKHCELRNVFLLLCVYACVCMCVQYFVLVYIMVAISLIYLQYLVYQKLYVVCQCLKSCEIIPLSHRDLSNNLIDSFEFTRPFDETVYPNLQM